MCLTRTLSSSNVRTRVSSLAIAFSKFSILKFLGASFQTEISKLFCLFPTNGRHLVSGPRVCLVVDIEQSHTVRARESFQCEHKNNNSLACAAILSITWSSLVICVCFSNHLFAGDNYCSPARVQSPSKRVGLLNPLVRFLYFLSICFRWPFGF